MSDAERTFHHFPRLPVELQLAVWRECLPHRIHEEDSPWDEVVFRLPPKAPSPCVLERTTYINGRPPIISRVCRASRAVALENGKFPVCEEDRPGEAQWVSLRTTDSWLDPLRDSMHLNSVPEYEVDYMVSGDPLKGLAWDAARSTHVCSFMIDWLLYEPNYTQDERLEVINRVPSWKVVMRVVVVHADRKTGAQAGLFGLLGDAMVQLVDVFDEMRVNAFFDLAEKCEQEGDFTVKQDLLRVPSELVKKDLQDTIRHTFGSGNLRSQLHPVIMFRLCTEMCTSPTKEKSDEDYYPKSEKQRDWWKTYGPWSRVSSNCAV